ncbi:protein HEXIM1 [Hydra vulgaris]|uniref:Protein HEXIM1 n=1 Tax=Hydra vulgaris TaxID=6087 RepID=A0ABM4CXT5_HYDVU
MTQECIDLKVVLEIPWGLNNTLENTPGEFKEQQNNDGAFLDGGLGTNENVYFVNAKREDESRLITENEEKNGFAKRRHRRGSRKNKPRKPRSRYKPFNKLTWDEKRQLDERDTVKALRRREELVLQKGRPIAPYNTTQFLMEEHNPGEENFQNQNTTLHPTTDLSEDSCSSSSSDEYFVKDFDEFYERVHIDTLNSYSKEDLIKYVFELEARIEKFERENKNSDNLKEENYKLLQEIKDLKAEKAKN